MEFSFLQIILAHLAIILSRFWPVPAVLLVLAIGIFVIRRIKNSNRGKRPVR